jgi:hypothetical protein
VYLVGKCKVMSSIPTNTTDDAKKAKTKAKSQSMPS